MGFSALGSQFRFLAVRKLLDGNGGPRGRRCRFGGAQPAAGATHARTVLRRRHDPRHRPRPHQPLGRAERSRQVAAAAARAGLKFVVFTDHGDATRPPDPPAYRSGVLCLDAVEISTEGGHYLALDMPAAPYPLGGDARGVVEDVKRLGGFGVVAHPNSPKPDLSWDDWDAPFDAIEWLNPDTSWRLKVRAPGWRSRWNIVAALAGYPFRSPETIAHLMGETDLGVSRWESFAHRRRVVLLAGADAHARLALTSAEPRGRGISLPLPGYEASFRTLSLHVRTRSAADPRRRARRDDDHAGDPARTRVHRRRRHRLAALLSVHGQQHAGHGERRRCPRRGWPGDAARPQQRALVVSHDALARWRTADDGARRGGSDAIRTGRSRHLSRGDRGAARLWDRFPGLSATRSTSASTFPGRRLPPNIVSDSRSLFDGRTAKWWRTEADATSTAALDVVDTPSGTELRMGYGLSSRTSLGQYASLAVELPQRRGAVRPRDLHRPLRAPAANLGAVPDRSDERKVGSDPSISTRPRTGSTRFASTRRRRSGAARTPHPDAKNIHDILFVVDTTHAKPGTSSRLWLKSAALQR